MKDLTLCSMCQRCRSSCPSGIDLTGAMMRMRSEAAPSRLEGHRRMLRNVSRSGRTVDGPQARPRRGGGTLFFTGCVSPARLPASYDAALAVMDLGGMDPSVPEGLVCCGAPVRKVGEEGLADALRQRNARLLEGAEAVVAACPGCVGELNERYGIEALHVVEAWHELRSRFAGRGGFPVRVALHHPCHLARGVGAHTREQTAQLVMSFAGVRLVELQDPSACCGGGGGLLAGYPEESAMLARSRAADAIGSGADLMVTSCPFCVISLRRAGGIGVMGLEEFILSRMR